MERTVRVFDTTMRDGEQTPGVHMTVNEKTAMATRLEAMGVATIEAGFPVSSPGDMEAVRQVAQRTRNCEVAALARCVSRDIDAAARALEPAVGPVVHVFLGTSDVHLEHKLHMSRAEAVKRVRTSVAQARAACGTVQFSPEDATRTERPFLRQIIGVAIEAGATRINIPDTVGCAIPSEYGPMIRDMVDFVGPEVIVSAHCHNDMGLATANAVAAAQNGAGQVEVTVNGIGERAGNAALEEVVVALEMKGIATTGVDMTRIHETSRYIAGMTAVPVQPNKAVVGANAFSHAAGIHQDGIIKNPRNYEFVPPTAVGAPGHRFVLTARSGRGAIAHQARQMGVELTAAQIESVYGRFLETADRKRGAVTDHELAAIVRDCA